MYKCSDKGSGTQGSVATGRMTAADSGSTVYVSRAAPSHGMQDVSSVAFTVFVGGLVEHIKSVCKQGDACHIESRYVISCHRVPVAS